MEIDSFQWCPETAWDSEHKKTPNLLQLSNCMQSTVNSEGGQITAGFPERLWCLHFWKYLNPAEEGPGQAALVDPV